MSGWHALRHEITYATRTAIFALGVWLPADTPRSLEVMLKFIFPVISWEHTCLSTKHPQCSHRPFVILMTGPKPRRSNPGRQDTVIYNPLFPPGQTRPGQLFFRDVRFHNTPWTSTDTYNRMLKQPSPVSLTNNFTKSTTNSLFPNICIKPLQAHLIPPPHLYRT